MVEFEVLVDPELTRMRDDFFRTSILRHLSSDLDLPTLADRPVYVT